MLLACSVDAVPGLPAYTVPACPFGLNGEPFALAALPGVFGACGVPQLFPALDPCCPVVGFTVGASTSASAVNPVATVMTTTHAQLVTVVRMSLCISTSRKKES